jgi:hypothetical protein
MIASQTNGIMFSLVRAIALGGEAHQRIVLVESTTLDYPSQDRSIGIQHKDRSTDDVD